MTVSIPEPDSVVLARYVPEANLRAGDLGAVVHAHGAAPSRRILLDALQ